MILKFPGQHYGKMYTRKKNHSDIVHLLQFKRQIYATYIHSGIRCAWVTALHKPMRKGSNKVLHVQLHFTKRTDTKFSLCLRIISACTNLPDLVFFFYIFKCFSNTY